MGPAAKSPVEHFVAQVGEFLTPLTSSGALTVLRHWERFVKAAALSPAQTAKPTTDTQIAFLGYLRSRGTVGGATARDYLLALPRALALAQGLWEPSFQLSPAAKRVAQRMSWELPPTKTLQRDPLTVTTLRHIAADTGVRADVRAALVVQFWLGARGINIYSTTHGRATRGGHQRLLMWKDLAWRGPDEVLVTLRQEKNATQHVGTFPAIPLVRSPDPSVLPCPISALLRMQHAAREAGRVGPNDAVFPAVTDELVNAALARHAPPGTKLTTHSARSGAATTAWEAGASDRAVRVTGRWRTDGAADRYARVSARMATAAMRAIYRKHTVAETDELQRLEAMVTNLLARHDRENGAGARAGELPATTTEPGSAGAAPAMVSGQIRINHMQGANSTIYLMARAADRRGEATWRAYLYDRDHDRTLRPRLGHGLLIEYETFQGTKAVEYFSKHSSLYETDPTPGSALDKDARLLRATMARPKPPKTVCLPDRDAAHRSARGMKNDHPRFTELYREDLDDYGLPGGELGVDEESGGKTRDETTDETPPEPRDGGGEGRA